MPEEARSDPPPLRAALLEASPSDFGLAPTSQLPDVWGALFELPVGPGDTATVIAVADGTASLYTTAGFGVVGAGGHPAVRRAADAFLQAVQFAEAELVAVSVSDGVPFPPRESLAIVALTHGGPRRIEVKSAEADAPSPVGIALRAGNHLLTQLRLTYEAVGRS